MSLYRIVWRRDGEPIHATESMTHEYCVKHRDALEEQGLPGFYDVRLSIEPSPTPQPLSSESGMDQ